MNPDVSGDGDQNQLHNVQGPERNETAGAQVQTAKWRGQSRHPAEGTERLTHLASSAPRDPGWKPLPSMGQEDPEKGGLSCLPWDSPLLTCRSS